MLRMLMTMRAVPAAAWLLAGLFLLSRSKGRCQMEKEPLSVEAVR